MCRGFLLCISTLLSCCYPRRNSVAPAEDNQQNQPENNAEGASLSSSSSDTSTLSSSSLTSSDTTSSAASENTHHGTGDSQFPAYNVLHVPNQMDLREQHETDPGIPINDRVNTRIIRVRDANQPVCSFISSTDQTLPLDRPSAAHRRPPTARSFHQTSQSASDSGIPSVSM